MPLWKGFDLLGFPGQEAENQWQLVVLGMKLLGASGVPEVSWMMISGVLEVSSSCLELLDTKFASANFGRTHTPFAFLLGFSLARA